MRIDSVDFFYLRMPEVLDIGDGSQDALLVRVRAGNHEGWGECEASPLTSIASWITPMSHSACKPIVDSVLGQRIERTEDIRAIRRIVRQNSFDLLQANHTCSGVDIALWDLLGRKQGEPVWRLLGQSQCHPKRPYASQLFGSTPEATFALATKTRRLGFSAAKFGWGPYGRDVREDALQVESARAGLGSDLDLMVDAGTVWRDDVDRAAERLPALEAAGVVWLEEPFPGEALHAYKELGRRTRIKLAGGEGSNSPWQARHMVVYGGVGFLQIDAGRVGGITSAYEAAGYAASRGVRFVNHTFTSSLALSASLQPYANCQDEFCEYPLDPKPLARDLTTRRLSPDPDGMIRIPEAPGLGMEVDLDVVRKYLVEVEIKVDGRLLFQSTPP